VSHHGKLSGGPIADCSQDRGTRCHDSISVEMAFYLTPELQLTDKDYNLMEYSNLLEFHRILAQPFDVSINGLFGRILDLSVSSQRKTVTGVWGDS